MPLGIAILQEAAAQAPLRILRCWLRQAERRGDEINARVYRHEISLRIEDEDVRADLRRVHRPYFERQRPGLGCPY